MKLPNWNQFWGLHSIWIVYVTYWSNKEISVEFHISKIKTRIRFRNHQRIFFSKYDATCYLFSSLIDNCWISYFWFACYIFVAEILGSAGEAISDLKLLFSLAEKFGYADWIQFDASVVRGLAYYTGIVFEVRFELLFLSFDLWFGTLPALSSTIHTGRDHLCMWGWLNLIFSSCT